MTNYITAVGATPTLTMPANLKDDPVTKAVYDNIMGNLPTRKPKVSVFCKICNLEFSSQVVLDTHIAGSKHQRKVQSQDLMKTLSDKEEGFERNSITGAIKCTLCDITLTSPHLLSAHVAGNKHQSKKGKRENGDNGGTPSKKLCSADGKTNGEEVKDSTATNATTGESSEGGEKVKEKPKKKERPLLSITIPACVTKLEENKTGGKFLCNPCQAHCNSDIQLSQHLASNKHLDKLSGKKKIPPTTTTGGFSKPWKTGYFGRGRGTRPGFGNTTRTLTSTIPSTNSWDSFSSAQSNMSLLNTSSSAASYGQSYVDPSLSSGYSDSYGLSSLGRGAALTDYSYDRSARSSIGRGSNLTYGRSDPYGRSAAAVATDPYGRVTSPYSRVDLYERVDYAAEYPVSGRPDDLTSYSRAAAPDYAAEYPTAYGSSQSAAAAAAAGRSLPITYTAPLSHNFVSGGSIL